MTTSSTTNTRLTALAVDATCQGNIVRWQTAFEVDTLGFNVARERGGSRDVINATLIPGAGLSGGGRRDYQIADLGAVGAAAAYWVEEVHFDLSSEWFGPVTAATTPVCGPADRPQPIPVATGGPGAAPSNDRDPGFTDDGMGGCALASGRGTPLRGSGGRARHRARHLPPRPPQSSSTVTWALRLRFRRGPAICRIR